MARGLDGRHHRRTNSGKGYKQLLGLESFLPSPSHSNFDYTRAAQSCRET